MSAENRAYPVRNPETVANMQGDFDAKLKANSERGQNQILSGEYQPYKGAGEAYLGDIFYAMLELNLDSRLQIAERVTEPMRRLSEEFGVPSVFASRGDLPPHVSLDVGIFRDMSPEEIQASREYLASSKSHIQPLTRILDGIHANLDTLVVAPNSILCASQFDESQGGPYKARRIIEKAMGRTPSAAARRLDQKDGIAGTLTPPYRYDDIFFMFLFQE